MQETEQALRYLGLCRKAGGVLRGDAMQSALEKKKAAIVLLAADASERTKRETAAKARRAGVPVWELEATRDTLSALLGFPCAAMALLANRGPAAVIVRLARQAQADAPDEDDRNEDMPESKGVGMGLEQKKG